MSTLDGAFIKAYRKGTATTAPQAVDVPRWTAHTVRDASLYGSPHAVLQPPHANFRPAASQVRPEDQEIANGEDSDLAEEPLEPAFEVTRFVWPAVVGQLISTAGSQFSNLVGLLESRSRQARKVLLASGSQRGEGRTTMVLTLAQVAAARGMRVALVDADFTNPQLAERLGLIPQLGVAEILDTDQPLAEALVESTTERLTLFPLTGPVDDAMSLARSRRLPAAIEVLQQHFDLVLIDSAPLTDDKVAIDLAALLAGSPITDGLVVRDPTRTSSDQAKDVGRRLAAAGIHQWDVADNFVGSAGGR